MLAVNRVNRRPSDDASHNAKGLFFESCDETAFIAVCRAICTFFSNMNILVNENVGEETLRADVLRGKDEEWDYRGFQWDEAVLWVLEAQVMGRDAVASKCEVAKSFLRCFEHSEDPWVRILRALSHELEKANNRIQS